MIGKNNKGEEGSNLYFTVSKLTASPSISPSPGTHNIHNQTFFVSDGEDLSTTELLNRLGAALGKPARLAPVSASLLGLLAQLTGKGEIAQRLLGNLQVDISMTKETLNWDPPSSVDEEFQKTAQWYLSLR